MCHHAQSVTGIKPSQEDTTGSVLRFPTLYSIICTQCAEMISTFLCVYIPENTAYQRMLQNQLSTKFILLIRTSLTCVKTLLTDPGVGGRCAKVSGVLSLA